MHKKRVYTNEGPIIEQVTCSICRGDGFVRSYFVISKLCEGCLGTPTQSYVTSRTGARVPFLIWVRTRDGCAYQNLQRSCGYSRAPTWKQIDDELRYQYFDYSAAELLETRRALERIGIKNI